MSDEKPNPGTRRVVVVAMAVAVALLALSGLHPTSPDGNYRGLPWSYTQPVSPCSLPNPFSGCGFTADPVGAVLDFAFWTLVGLMLVSSVLVLRERSSANYSSRTV